MRRMLMWERVGVFTFGIVAQTIALLIALESASAGICSVNDVVSQCKTILSGDTMTHKTSRITGDIRNTDSAAARLAPLAEFNGLPTDFDRKSVAAKATKALPALDRTGKVHGALPKAEDLSRYSRDELRQLQQELRQSVQERIRKTSELGPDRAHGQRQGAEQQLIIQIEKFLSGS